MSSNLLMPPVVILTNGVRQPWNKVLDYSLSGGVITINRVAGSAITISPNSPDDVLAQLDKVPTMLASPITIEDTASTLTWVSIDPAVSSIGGSYNFIITGTGFTSVINGLRLDHGAGSLVPLNLSGVTSQTELDADNFFNPLPNTGTFTLYYSTDGGATWTTTALTVTVS